MLNSMPMSQFVIEGKKPLRGEVTVRGAKNAATKMMVASLLTGEECVLENIPFSLEIETIKELCENVGSEVELAGDHVCKIKTPVITNSSVPELSRRNRIPILALGPLLARTGVAEVPMLGGDPIGHRPINFHIEALKKMGIAVEQREHSYYAHATAIHGAEITLPFPSVGATENVLLCAVLATGKTFIKNAATEPEIQNLIDMLRAMGAIVDVRKEDRVISIEGVKKLRGVRCRVMPDRNEIVSFASVALATGGDVFVREAKEEFVAAFLGKIREVGAEAFLDAGGIRFKGKNEYGATSVTTAPHPGFMTDWQQPFSILLTQGNGASIIHETVYEDRMGYTKDLKRMGARIEVSDQCPRGQECHYAGKGFKHVAKIHGPTVLRGTEISIVDIRAGIAHVIAALSAEGQSIISGIEHIDRGYEWVDERLRRLGANIERRQTTDTALKAQDSKLKATA